MTKIYVIRHAEAEGNIYRRIHGQYNSKLTRNGYRQIAALEKRFADVHIDAVYASDLFRTCETAKALYLPKGLPLHPDPRFRETDVGRWEDTPFGQLDVFEAEQMHYFTKEPEKWQIEGAESFEEYTGRFIAGLRDLGEAYEGKTVAVFTHGCISSGGFRAMFGTGPLDGLRCDNTGVTLLTYDQGRFACEFMYDNSHLTPEISTLAHQLWWRGKEPFNLWYRPAVPEDAGLFDPELTPPGDHEVTVAVLDRTPVGYLSLKRRGDTADLSTLYLVPERRYRRMGDQLLGQAVCALRKEGLTRLRIGVPTANTPALSFIARLGGETEQMDDLYTVFHFAI